jgi:hypothetical protein
VEHSAVLRFDARTGTFIDVFIPSGSGGLNAPLGLAFERHGMLYIANRNAGNVLRFNGNTGAFIGVAVPLGAGGLSEPVELLVW